MDSDLARIKVLLAHACAIPADVIRDDTHLTAYGLDSVRAMDFILAIEEAFGVEFADDQAARLKTVADVARYVQRQQRT
jgi:acyl carrier protein